MTEYKTLSALLASEHAHELAFLINGASYVERVAKTEEVFFSYANDHFDEGALKAWKYLMAALDDDSLIDLTIDSGGVRALPSDKHGETAIADALYEAAIKRAYRAIDVFARIPSVRTEKRRNHDRDRFDNRDFIDIHHATLTATKKAILEEMSEGWRIARGEDEALGFFKALRDAKLHHEQKNLVLDTVRSVTDAGKTYKPFPPYRILHTMVECAVGTDEALMTALELAWLKLGNRTARNVAHFATEPMLQSHVIPGMYTARPSASMWAFTKLRSIAAKLQALDVDIQTMLQNIGLSSAKVEFANMDCEQHFPIATVSWEGKFRDQNEAHKSFEHYRDKAKKWLEDHRPKTTYVVDLVYHGVYEWNYRQDCPAPVDRKDRL